MKRCDSCGKLITDSKDVMCPFCGAVSQKSTVCTHEVQEDRWNRSGNTYSFHGDDYNDRKAVGEPEVNINKMFSFGSEAPREKHTREQKAFKSQNKKTKSGKKASPGTVVFIFVLLSVFISFVSNAGFFSEIFGDSYTEVSCDCAVDTVSVKITDGGEVLFEFPDGIEAFDDIVNIVDDADEGSVLINEIPYEETKGIDYDSAALKGVRYNLVKRDGAYSPEGFYPSFDDCVIVLSDFILEGETEEYNILLPFDAVRIGENAVSFFTVSRGEYGEAVFTPYESGV